MVFTPSGGDMFIDPEQKALRLRSEIQGAEWFWIDKALVHSAPCISERSWSWRLIPVYKHLTHIGVKCRER